MLKYDLNVVDGGLGLAQIAFQSRFKQVIKLNYLVIIFVLFSAA
jgi:hypothetical protein